MCGICGFVNFKSYPKINNIDTIDKMRKKLYKRGPDENGLWNDEICFMGHNRLVVVDAVGGKQPMIKDVNGSKYILVYNGQIYNCEELRSDLKSKGYSFDSYSDTEVILKTYACYKERCIDYLNGIFAFAIWDKYNNSLFFARDHLGVKPLFYALTSSNTFIFSSEIKGLLEHPEVTARLDNKGVCELIGLGPARSPGNTYFQNIFEIKRGHAGTFTSEGLNIFKYWDVSNNILNDSFNIAKEKIQYLVSDSLKRQLISDVPLCTMLSGGLDSSLLTTLAKKDISELSTFSIDYIDNNKNFEPNQYQPSSDNEYIKIMVDYLQTKHKNISVDTYELFDLLFESMTARDMPGMADIDSSLFSFCNSIKENGYTVCISGECSDEIFGGYPWFYREDLLDLNTFPWALSNDIREKLINPNRNICITDYINDRYNECIKNAPIKRDKLNKDEIRYKEINYLTIEYFMQVLLERNDRMAMSNALETRVPYADYRIFEYVYSLPSNIKLKFDRFGNVIEKNLLRESFKDILPYDIVYRKKSPFPKTFNPSYYNLVKDILNNILDQKDSKLNQIINKNYLKEIIHSDGKNLDKNWFGQLMTVPQFFAYLIQIDMWLDEYNIEIV